MKIYLSKAIQIKGKNWKVVCDSTNSSYYPLVFYSHAHSDHIPKRLPKTDIITSTITKMLLKNFTSNYDEPIYHETFSNEYITIEQKSSGHIVGSTAMIIESDEGKVIYTGDVSIRNKGFLKPFKPEKCDKLIIESTFGTPEYSFPEYEETIRETRDLISDYLEKDVPVVLMGYALGKAQMLYHSFSDLSETIIMHGSNFKINSLLLEEDIGGSISAMPYVEAKEKELFEKKSNWILYTPLKSGRDAFFMYLKKKYDAKLFAFSGWCISPDYKFRMSVDHGVPISDHADYKELVEICKKCDPDHIYTIYGDNIRFASELRKLGFNAYPLSKQTLLDSYF